MDFYLAFLAVLLFSSLSPIDSELSDAREARLHTSATTMSTGRRLKQNKDKIRITEGRYKGDFFSHDDIVIAFAAGSQISNIKCAIIRDPNIITPIHPCKSPVNLSPYLKIDGMYGFAVMGRDTVDKKFVNDTNIFIIDRTPPQTDLFEVHQQGDEITFEFNGEDAWKVPAYECRLDRADWVFCSSPMSYKVGLGDHVFKVRAIDPAGNSDPNPAQHEWTVFEDDVEVSALSNEVETAEGDGGASKLGIVAIAIFVPLAVATLVGIVIFLNRKKLAVIFGKGQKGDMVRIP